MDKDKKIKSLKRKISELKSEISYLISLHLGDLPDDGDDDVPKMWKRFNAKYKYLE